MKKIIFIVSGILVIIEALIIFSITPSLEEELLILFFVGLIVTTILMWFDVDDENSLL